MKIRTIFLLLVLILMAVFLVINWTALSTVTAVNLIYTEIQAPLGVLVVGGFAAVVFVLLIYMVWRRRASSLELRAAYKEARNARTVADDAEKSRFAESNRILLERIEKLEALMTARSDETLTAVRQEGCAFRRTLPGSHRRSKEGTGRADRSGSDSNRRYGKTRRGDAPRRSFLRGAQVGQSMRMLKERRMRKRRVHARTSSKTCFDH